MSEEFRNNQDENLEENGSVHTITIISTVKAAILERARSMTRI
ncbi:MAG: hypothetical protein ACLR6B_13210 [Blautia sp.]